MKGNIFGAQGVQKAFIQKCRDFVFIEFFFKRSRSLSLPYHARVPAQIHNNKIGQQSKSISRLLITVCIKGSGFLRNSMFSPVGEGSSILRAEPAYEYI